MEAFNNTESTHPSSFFRLSSMGSLSRPSTPSPSLSKKTSKAFKIVRSLSIGDLPKKLKRKKFSFPSSRSPSPPPPVPQLPPLPFPPTTTTRNRESIYNVHFDALEFLTLDPEPWVGVSLSHNNNNVKREDTFGLLPSNFRLTRRKSLLSLYSFYSSRSYEGEEGDIFPTSPTLSTLADLQEFEDDQALRTPSDSPSRASSRNGHTPLVRPRIVAPAPPPPTPTDGYLPISTTGTYTTHGGAYLPEFRNSVIMLDKPAPPRPPRRSPPAPPPRRVRRTSTTGGGGHSSQRSRGGSVSNESPLKQGAAPLLTRRLTSNSSSTSLSQSVRSTSGRSGRGEGSSLRSSPSVRSASGYSAIAPCSVFLEVGGGVGSGVWLKGG